MGCEGPGGHSWTATQPAAPQIPEAVRRRDAVQQGRRGGGAARPRCERRWVDPAHGARRLVPAPLSAADGGCDLELSAVPDAGISGEFAGAFFRQPQSFVDERSTAMADG